MYTKLCEPRCLEHAKDLMGGRPLHLAGRKKLVRHVAGDPDHFRECNDTDVKPSARSQEIGRFLDELRLIGEVMECAAHSYDAECIVLKIQIKIGRASCRERVSSPV